MDNRNNITTEQYIAEYSPAAVSYDNTLCDNLMREYAASDSKRRSRGLRLSEQNNQGDKPDYSCSDMTYISGKQYKSAMHMSNNGITRCMQRYNVIIKRVNGDVSIISIA